MEVFLCFIFFIFGIIAGMLNAIIGYEKSGD